MNRGLVNLPLRENSLIRIVFLNELTGALLHYQELIKAPFLMREYGKMSKKGGAI
ncbi:hypothetical protein [Peribacillus simplex]|uniref:hypothetical protein n=1 Tax=Peribacillus simplex TaxID=1478 RepID=UPI00333CBE57